MPIKFIVNTHQEAFDAVLRHLVTLPSRAVSEPPSSVCLYLTEDGRRCAISAILDCTDEQRRDLQRMVEESGIRRLVKTQTVDAGNMDVEFLAQLQTLHDQPSNWGPGGWRGWTQAHDIATTWNLDRGLLNEMEPDDYRIIRRTVTTTEEVIA